MYQQKIMTFAPTIGRNAPCHCGSQKRFKECHGSLGTAPNPKPGQIDALLRKSQPKPTCLAPAGLQHNCRGSVIASHTVSRSGSLGEIEKSGHVYSFPTSIQRLAETNGKMVPNLFGWRNASTFPGFCAHHDKHLFAPLEDVVFTGSQHQCFLLSYRSIAWELYAKQRANNQGPYRSELVASKNLLLQPMMDRFNDGCDLGLRDLKVLKANYDDVLVNQRWSDCHGLLIEFDHIFPIQCSTGWFPTEDIHGNSLQTLDDTSRTPEAATIVSFAANGKSYFMLSWLPDSATVASKLADSINTLPGGDVAGVVAAFLLLVSENCHLSPDWYEALSEPGKDWVQELASPENQGKPTPASAGGSNYIGSIGVTSLLRF